MTESLCRRCWDLVVAYLLCSVGRAARLSAVPFVGFVVAMVMLAAASLRADTYNWNVSSGDWSNAGNWLNSAGSPGVPSSSDTAWINNGETVTITIPGEVCADLSVWKGAVQMTGGNLSTIFNNGNVERGLPRTGTFTQSGGTNLAGNLYVGGRERHRRIQPQRKRPASG